MDPTYMNSGGGAYNKTPSTELQKSAQVLGTYCESIHMPISTDTEIMACGNNACDKDDEYGKIACDAFNTILQIAKASHGDVAYQGGGGLHPTGRGGAFPLQDLSGRSSSGYNLRTEGSRDSPLTWFNAAATMANTNIDFQNDPVHKYALCMKKHNNDKHACAVYQNVNDAHSEFYKGFHMKPGFSGAFRGKLDPALTYIQSKTPHGDGELNQH